MKFKTKIQVYVPKFGDSVEYVVLPPLTPFIWGDEVQVEIKFTKSQKNKCHTQTKK